MEEIRALNGLYHSRGYPDEIVKNWCRKNLQERWEKRFAIRNNEPDEGVLVLKTQFDDHWNWFSAAELGETVAGYWKEWLERARVGNYSNAYPFWDAEQDNHTLKFISPQYESAAKNLEGEDIRVPDLGLIGILGRRWIVSRKRTTNLFDLANVWKKTVLTTLDADLATFGGKVSRAPPSTDPPVHDPSLSRTSNPRVMAFDSDDEDIDLHRHDLSDDEKHLELGRMSKRRN